jgi:D-glutamate cyclase
MIDWQQLEAVIRRDPGGRGLASYQYSADANSKLLLRELPRAAQDLAKTGKRVLIVTGFPVVTEQGVTAETDGPLGALFLAGMLHAAKMEPVVAVDGYAAPVLRAGLAATGLAQTTLIEFPQTADDAASRDVVFEWRRLNAEYAEQYSHIVFVERVGPSHTLESISAQAFEPDRAEVLAEFERLVPPAERDVCHNMRGVSIDAYVAPLHKLLFPPGWLRVDPKPPTSIGIADGGNEIGCGNIPWFVAHRAIAQGPAAIVACRIPADHTILAGTSNWGAYALGAAVAALRGAKSALTQWTVEREQAILAAVVAAGAVDGVTKRREPTVDGLTADQYFGVFEEVRQICLAAT